MQSDQVKRRTPNFRLRVAAVRRAAEALQAAVAQLDGVVPPLAAAAPVPRKKAPVQRPFKAPLKGSALAAWRNARRSGHPSRIDCDPELRAFILATLPGSTYTATVAAIAAAFPPERRIGKTALATWWQANRPRPSEA